METKLITFQAILSMNMRVLPRWGKFYSRLWYFKSIVDDKEVLLKR